MFENKYLRWCDVPKRTESWMWNKPVCAIKDMNSRDIGTWVAIDFPKITSEQSWRSRKKNCQGVSSGKSRWARATTHSPGGTAPVNRSTVIRFSMSESIESATPGYCTFTATSEPSWRTARCTCVKDGTQTMSCRVCVCVCVCVCVDNVYGEVWANKDVWGTLTMTQ